MPLYLGAHVIDTGGIDMAVRRAAAAGMRAMQIFTAIPKYYGDKSSIRPERVARFRAALDETPIEARYVQSHAAYVLNLATGDPEKYARARGGLVKEMERSVALGIGAVCVHPGAATDGDGTSATDRVADAVAAALDAVPGTTRLLVENTAGAGRTVGRNADEIGAILSAIPKKLRARSGYGLDTCHLFASGHDITSSPAALRKVLDEFESAAGEPPGFFHLNDSEGAFGSNKDRHMLLGEGQIGLPTFQWLLHDKRAKNVPLILETPQANPDIAADDASPDPADEAMMAILTSASES
jgi:deoxyribonuclease-4